MGLRGGYYLAVSPRERAPHHKLQKAEKNAPYVGASKTIEIRIIMLGHLIVMESKCPQQVTFIRLRYIRLDPAHQLRCG